MRRSAKIPLALAALAMAGVLAGCTDPYARTAPRPAGQETGSPGEPTAPSPTPVHSERPSAAAPTPQAALERYARLYSNWTYRTLARSQQALAALAVGPARRAERQAVAASKADSTIRRAHVTNDGQVLAIAPEKAQRGWWVIVTCEQTAGSSEYEALPASDHVILAQAVRVDSGWAVQQWQPQD